MEGAEAIGLFFLSSTHEFTSQSGNTYLFRPAGLTLAPLLEFYSLRLRGIPITQVRYNR